MKMYFQLFMMLTAFVLLSADEQKSDGGFRDVGLELHNYYRARLHLVPLREDSALNIVAHKHAEKLASSKSFHSSGVGYGEKENLWAHFGPLRPLAADATDAVNCWFLGTTRPGNTIVAVQRSVLWSNQTTHLGFGIGTSDDYTVVVANYL